MNREVTTQTSTEEWRALDRMDLSWHGPFAGPDAVFADPVGYLRRLGIEAELVEERAGSLFSAA